MVSHSMLIYLLVLFLLVVTFSCFQSKVINFRKVLSRRKINFLLWLLLFWAWNYWFSHLSVKYATWWWILVLLHFILHMVKHWWALALHLKINNVIFLVITVYLLSLTSRFTTCSPWYLLHGHLRYAQALLL